jgi:hypothetical protein
MEKITDNQQTKKDRNRTALSQFALSLYYFSKIDGGSISINIPNFYFEQLIREGKEEEFTQIVEAFSDGEENMYNELKKYGEVRDEDMPSCLKYYNDNYFASKEKEEALEDVKWLEEEEAKEKEMATNSSQLVTDNHAFNSNNDNI